MNNKYIASIDPINNELNSATVEITKYVGAVDIHTNRKETIISICVYNMETGCFEYSTSINSFPLDKNERERKYQNMVNEAQKHFNIPIKFIK